MNYCRFWFSLINIPELENRQFGLASGTSKNRQFMQKNQERTGGYLIFWKTNPILENCGNISGFQFFDFWESQLWTLRITLIIVRVSVSVSDNYPITLVKTSAWSLLYPHEEPPVLVQKKWIKFGFWFWKSESLIPIWFLLTQIKTQQLTISQPLVFITFFFVKNLISVPILVPHLNTTGNLTPARFFHSLRKIKTRSWP